MNEPLTCNVTHGNTNKSVSKYLLRSNKYLNIFRMRGTFSTKLFHMRFHNRFLNPQQIYQTVENRAKTQNRISGGYQGRDLGLILLLASFGFYYCFAPKKTNPKRRISGGYPVGFWAQEFENDSLESYTPNSDTLSANKYSFC